MDICPRPEWHGRKQRRQQARAQAREKYEMMKQKCEKPTKQSSILSVSVGHSNALVGYS